MESFQAHIQVAATLVIHQGLKVWTAVALCPGESLHAEPGCILAVGTYCRKIAEKLVIHDLAQLFCKGHLSSLLATPLDLELDVINIFTCEILKISFSRYFKFVCAHFGFVS